MRWSGRVFVGSIMALMVAGLTSAGIAHAAKGPKFQEPRAELAGALDCSEDLSTSKRRPVLLVHGTGTGPELNWRDGFEAALAYEGRATCIVGLPANGLVDLQRSTEYVVFALRHMYRTTDRRVAALGHSQGGFEPVWALRFWPDLRRKVRDVVALGTPYEGIVGGVLSCTASTCPEAFWQFRPDSAFLTRLRAGDPTRKGVDYTSIYTDYDQVASPAAERDQLEGASLVGVQELCPGRPVDHFLLADDAATFRLASHALRHPGRFTAAEVDPARACGSLMPPGVDPAERLPHLPELPAALAEALATAPYTSEEPPLRRYARE